MWPSLPKILRYSTSQQTQMRRKKIFFFDVIDNGIVIRNQQQLIFSIIMDIDYNEYHSILLPIRNVPYYASLNLLCIIKSPDFIASFNFDLRIESQLH
jgi:hypothetical protein